MTDEDTTTPVSLGDTNTEQASPNRGETLRGKDDEPSDVEKLASTIVIPSFEREALEARESADLAEMQEVQDRYHDARMEKAQRQLDREAEGNE